jgi:hypothetical protein
MHTKRKRNVLEFSKVQNDIESATRNWDAVIHRARTPPFRLVQQRIAGPRDVVRDGIRIRAADTVPIRQPHSILSVAEIAGITAINANGFKRGRSWCHDGCLSGGLRGRCDGVLCG